VIKRSGNANRARAKRGVPAVLDSDGVVCGGIIRRVSPAMIDAYWEYIADEYAQVRALTTTDLMLVHVAGRTAGHPLGTSGVRHPAQQQRDQARAAEVLGNRPGPSATSHHLAHTDRGRDPGCPAHPYRVALHSHQAGLCRFGPVVGSFDCPRQRDCANCGDFVITGADYSYWERKYQQACLEAEAADNQEVRDYLYRRWKPTRLALDGLQKALVAAGMWDSVQDVDVRTPAQDFFDPIWSSGWTADDLVRLGGGPASDEGKGSDAAFSAAEIFAAGDGDPTDAAGEVA
jgi:hypothetical protein